jgi:hypothetical protein
MLYASSEVMNYHKRRVDMVGDDKESLKKMVSQKFFHQTLLAN